MNVNIVEKGIYKHVSGKQVIVLATAQDSLCYTYIVYMNESGDIFARPSRSFVLGKEADTADNVFTYTGQVANKLPKHDTTNILNTEDASITFKLKYREKTGIPILVKVK